MKIFQRGIAGILLVLVTLTGCSSTKYARDFNLPTTEGKAIAHVSSSNLAVHLFMGKDPLWGDASLEKTVSDFTQAAKMEGASKVRIVQSSSRAWWFVFFPFTLILTPVTSNVAGDAVSA
ncbi:MAG: hypothetical protein ACOY3K_04485 [Candidatus Omnitrophota bacterium]